MTSKKDFAKKSLFELKEKLEVVINDLLDQEIIDAAKYSEYAQDYIAEAKQITLAGGKRLRGALVYYSYLIHGGREETEILKIAAAVELIHTFLLIEDDFMDLADLRRGYETLHEKYRKYHQGAGLKGDARHFGNSVAVTVGIIVDHLAVNMIARSGFPAELKLRALIELNSHLVTTGHGQVHDVLNEVRGGISREEILNVLEWKTAVYTYDNPLRLGAILAGADDDQLRVLTKYAIPAGIAFQIQDDIIGTFGEEGTTGKPTDSDLKEGKQTLLTFHVNEYGTKEQQNILSRVLGNHDASADEIEKARQVMVETQAAQSSKDTALVLVKEAKQVIEEHFKKLDLSDQSRAGVDFLLGIADYMIERRL